MSSPQDDATAKPAPSAPGGDEPVAEPSSEPRPHGDPAASLTPDPDGDDTD